MSIVDQTGVCARCRSDGQSPISVRALRICEMLARDLSQTPSLAQLAKRAGTNRNTLTREFRDTFGQSPFAWLREQRLLRAKALLCETDWPIYRISDAVGYPDPNHFSTSFKRRFGVSPRRLRGSGAASGGGDEADGGLSSSEPARGESRKSPQGKDAKGVVVSRLP